jgi:hypothetical protein
LVEVHDLSQAVLAKLANISTWAFVSTGNNIVIAGFILGSHSGDDRVVLRGIGPSLTVAGVANALADPTLELHDGNGALIASNNNQLAKKAGLDPKTYRAAKLCLDERGARPGSISSFET